MLLGKSVIILLYISIACSSSLCFFSIISAYLNKEVIKYVTGDNCVWEQEPMKLLASSKQLNAYKHEGFWQPMDTLRDKKILEEYWLNGNAPWKSW